jgi:hypothetical protein
MQITARKTPEEVDQTVRDRVYRDVEDALSSVVTSGDRFIVNDTPWYAVSGGRLKARVTNTAGYISKTFQDFLKQNRGWTAEKKLEGQRIDAYLELDHPAGFTLTKSALFGLLEQLTTEHPDESPDTTTIRLFQMYVKRSLFDIQPIASKYHQHFSQATTAGKLRVGLEFETGNIASSFRSLNKLGFLYRRGKIDAGVFITSIDKAHAAARIWPRENRNGSFEELDRRQYRDAVFFPIWEFGFAPDDFDRNAPYLGSNGTTYTLQATGRTEQHGRHTYEVWTRGQEELLRRT